MLLSRQMGGVWAVNKKATARETSCDEHFSSKTGELGSASKRWFKFSLFTPNFNA